MAEQSKDLVPFEGNEGTKNVRRVWHNGEWYYSVIDLIGVLADSLEPRKYWNTVKARAETEVLKILFDKLFN